MAIAFGASLGTPVNDTENSATTVALTTNVTVPSNARLIVAVSWYNTGVTASMGGGSLTWTLDKQQNGVSDIARHFALFSADASSGLASGTTLTATFSGGAFGRAIFGVYFTGLATSSAVDVTSSGQGTTAVWNTGAQTTNVADEAIVGACWFDGLVGTNSPDGTDTEALDFNNGLNASWCFEYRTVSATASLDLGGTWSGGTTPEWLAVMAAYKIASGGSGATVAATGQPADATADAPNPVFSAGSNVTTPVADATGTAPASSFPIDIEIAPGPASATGDAPDPVISVPASITSPAADATGDTPNPAVSGGASVTSPAATGAGDAPEPSVSGSQQGEIATAPADAAGSVPVPSLSAGSSFTASAADAAGSAPAPSQVGTPAVIGPALGIADGTSLAAFRGTGNTTIAAHAQADTGLAAWAFAETELVLA